MLIPIKVFTVDTRIPAIQDLEDAQKICITKDCMVELRWMPSTFTGWYHLIIKKDSDLTYMYEHQVPKTYGV